ncbi:MAG TPA: hypothetical protein VJ719_11040 [Chthoniobacterales bacterium]|nr:hypothetical protein [Chthoniobacterales bacterium]
MSEQANRSYETRDANVRLIVGFAAGLIAAAIAIHLALAGLYKLFEQQHPSPDAPSRIAFDTRIVAPEPQLQINPQQDLAKFESDQNALLNSYGWVNREQGVIRIPIERAMDLIVERGLPTRGPGTNNSSGITPEQLQHQKAAATAPQQPIKGDK